MKLIRQGQSFSGREKNCAFINTRGTEFANASAVSGLDFPDDARASGWFDWDHDGDLDLWVANRTAPQLRFLRNDLDSPNRFLALRLTGTECNRDAVGARVRVVLEGEEQPIWRTVRAGSGYLSQSSKWLHFGLGDNAAIRDVQIQWPGGEETVYSTLQPDRFYNIVQGQQANELKFDAHTPLPPPKSPQPVFSEKEPQSTSLYSATRLPLPRMAYQDRNGKTVPLDISRPTLVVLWASWCQPCVTELSQLAKFKSQFESQDLRILLLSVDKLDPNGADPSKVTELIEKLGVPYEFGFATESTTQKLQLATDYLFLLQQPLPVPSTFLVDTDYRLAALYRGPVKPEEVIRDAKRLDAALTDKRDASVPFSGRWLGKPKTLRLAPFVTELARAGLLTEASEYVQRMQKQFDRPTIVDLVVRLGIEYEVRSMKSHADLHFRMARKIDPQTVMPELMLARHWHNEGAYSSAISALETNCARRPHPLLVNELAWMLATCKVEALRNPERAEELSRTLFKKDNTAPRVLDTYAVSLAANGEFHRAVELESRALTLAQKQRRHRLANEIQQRLTLFRAGQSYIAP